MQASQKQATKSQTTCKRELHLTVVQQTSKMDVDHPTVHYQQPTNIRNDVECQRNGEPAGVRNSPLRRMKAFKRKKRQMQT